MTLELDHLNAAQRRAVCHRDGALLVLAGAGTGKTRVITYRMAALIEEGVAPESILALTFTQKAAGEMRERLGALVGKKVARRGVVGTFHAFGARLLRADAHRLDVTNAFSILDEGDQRAQVRRLMREARIEEKRCPVPEVVAAISVLKNQGALPNAVLTTEPGSVAMQLREAYDRHLRALGTLDFDDLILMPTQLLLSVADVAARVQNRFQHVLVDEFQDTARPQMDLLQAVTRRSRTVCAVGDDDQAIYGWRGAVVEHILEFEKYFPGAQAVALEENYRSTPQILDAANHVIRCNRNRRAKTLQTRAMPGVPVRATVAQDDEGEVRLVTQTIAERVRKGEKAEVFAILFRTGTQSRPFEAALRLEGVPYVLVGGMDITERREVKDALAHAAMLAGRNDETAFRRVVATPSRGVGSQSVDRLLAWARSQDLGLADAAARAAQCPGLQKKAATVLSALGQLLVSARDAQAAAPADSDPAERLDRLLQDTGYMQALMAEEDLARQARNKQNVDLVLRALGQLSNRMADSLTAPSEVSSRVALDEGTALDQLLDRMALDGRDQDRNSEGEDRRPGVRLMTLHAAKGLEFPVVFLPGWEDGLMPHRRSLADAERGMDPALQTQGDETDDGGTPPVVSPRTDAVEEERRLAYVAITRARQELVITRAFARRRYGKLETRLPSRFLGELPEGVEHQDLTEKAMTDEERRQRAAERFKALRQGLGGA